MFDVHDSAAIEKESTHEERHAADKDVSSQIVLPLFVICAYFSAQLLDFQVVPLIGLWVGLSVCFVVGRRLLAYKSRVDATSKASSPIGQRWRTDRRVNLRPAAPERTHIEIGRKHRPTLAPEETTFQ